MEKEPEMRSLIFATLLAASTAVCAQGAGWWESPPTLDETRFIENLYTVTCHSVGPDNQFYSESHWLTEHQANEVNRTRRVDWVNPADNPNCEAVLDPTTPSR